MTITRRVLPVLSLLGLLFAGTTQGAGSHGEGLAPDAPIKIEDPWIQRLRDLTYDQKPPRPVPGVHYGMDAKTGAFRHPKATPMVNDPPNFPGQLDHWDQRSYAHNMEVLATIPTIASPFHSWQNIVDWGDRRIMYVYGSRNLKIFDITDPRKPVMIGKKGADWSGKGPSEETDPFAPGDKMGAATIQWHKGLGKYVMVQSFEVERIGLMEDKLKEPDKVRAAQHFKTLKGFKVYAMDGPLPHEWRLLAEVPTDFEHRDAPVGQQRGSGSLDVPAWFGGQYMLLAAAPDESFGLTEYPDYLYSPGYQTWEMSDPAKPKFVSQFAALGQILGDPAHEEAFLMNPRAGNRTSWMGARMPPFLVKPIEQGGTLAFGAMAGLGLHVLDVSDPAHIKDIGSVSTAPRFGGTEFDNVDVSQYERTGYVLANGYPMNDECFEPYKDIWVIDARDPTRPRVAGALPRPVPPKDAPFTDYCQRKGSFGPKRPGYHVTQPGRWKQGVVAYAFYNAGVQVFDVTDPMKAKIAAYYVPRFPTEAEAPDYVTGNLAFGIYVEYDRNIVWLFTNYAIYALATPAIGEPVIGMPKVPWPPRS
jgi:hypothetical protein